MPYRHALADSPRSPKVRHRTVTAAPRDAAKAMAPPARQTKSPACALTTRTGPSCREPVSCGAVMAVAGLPRIPYFLGGLDDQRELGPLLLLGEVVAFLSRGEAALRREAQLVAVDEPGGLVNPPLQVILALELAFLGCDE